MDFMQSVIEHLIAAGLGQFVSWVGSIGGFAAAVPVLLELAKRSRMVPWLDAYTDHLNRAVAVILGALAASTISYSYDGAATRLVVDGLSIDSTAKMLASVATQLGLQEIVYRRFVKGWSRA